jgi:hypothetical protein
LADVGVLHAVVVAARMLSSSLRLPCAAASLGGGVARQLERPATRRPSVDIVGLGCVGGEIGAGQLGERVGERGGMGRRDGGSSPYAAGCRGDMRRCSGGVRGSGRVGLRACEMRGGGFRGGRRISRRAWGCAGAGRLGGGVG